MSNFDENPNERFLDALSEEQIAKIEEEVQRAGGMPKYMLERVKAMLEEMQIGDLDASIKEEDNYRGSGKAIPIDIKRGEKEIVTLPILTLPGGVFFEAIVGYPYISDEGIKELIAKALEEEGPRS